MAQTIERPVRPAETGAVVKAVQGPDLYEKLLAYGSILLFAAVVIALLRGASRWDQMPFTIWAHLATVMVPLAITPVQLLRRRGGNLHRNLGWIWATGLFATAIISIFIRNINPGGLSLIHVFTLITLIFVPLLVWSARTGRITQHRGAVRGLVTGALLIAGYFTLVPGRLLGTWLFG